MLLGLLQDAFMPEEPVVMGLDETFREYPKSLNELRAIGDSLGYDTPTTVSN
jgi:hypothetical protein